MKVYIVGTPGRPAGACQEAWHTCKLWRSHGLDVTLVPTGPLEEYAARLAAIGVEIRDGRLGDVALPAGSIVVAFCNHPFLRLVGPRLRRQGCRLVWVGCMNQLTTAERELLDREGPFDAYVFQSRYQRRRLEPIYRAAGAGNFHRIPGALDVDEFPFRPRPHRPGRPFVVGRLSRAHRLKYAADLWQIYGRIPAVRARVMGWSGTVEAHCGKPPAWAEVLKVAAEPALDFYRSLHAIVHPGGEAVENWPRYVLEAMAAGVPVITDNSGGIPELIADGREGLLCSTSLGMSQAACVLAEQDQLRMAIASAARARVEDELADPDMIFSRWTHLFNTLTD